MLTKVPWRRRPGGSLSDLPRAPPPTPTSGVASAPIPPASMPMQAAGSSMALPTEPITSATSAELPMAPPPTPAESPKASRLSVSSTAKPLAAPVSAPAAAAEAQLGGAISTLSADAREFTPPSESGAAPTDAPPAAEEGAEATAEGTEAPKEPAATSILMSPLAALSAAGAGLAAAGGAAVAAVKYTLSSSKPDAEPEAERTPMTEAFDKDNEAHEAAGLVEEAMPVAGEQKAAAIAPSAAESEAKRTPMTEAFDKDNEAHEAAGQAEEAVLVAGHTEEGMPVVPSTAEFEAERTPMTEAFDKDTEAHEATRQAEEAVPIAPSAAESEPLAPYEPAAAAADAITTAFGAAAAAEPAASGAVAETAASGAFAEPAASGAAPPTEPGPPPGVGAHGADDRAVADLDPNFIAAFGAPRPHASPGPAALSRAAASSVSASSMRRVSVTSERSGSSVGPPPGVGEQGADDVMPEDLDLSSMASAHHHKSPSTDLPLMREACEEAGEAAAEGAMRLLPRRPFRAVLTCHHVPAWCSRLAQCPVACQPLVVLSVASSPEIPFRCQSPTGAEVELHSRRLSHHLAAACKPQPF